MKKKYRSLKFILIFLSVSNCFFSQQSHSVSIGNQIWNKANLNVSVFRNGDTIPEAKTKEQWLKAAKEGKPAWCFYKNNIQNGNIYGKLYNWYAVNDDRNLAPLGWRIPYAEDFVKLAHYHGLNQFKLKSKKGWTKAGNPKIHLYDGNGENTFGFNGLPAGFRDENGEFASINYYSGFWSLTTKNDSTAWNLNLCSSNNGPDLSSYQLNGIGLSVRLIFDDGLRDSNRVNEVLRLKIEELIKLNKFDSATIFLTRLYNNNGFLYYKDYYNSIYSCMGSGNSPGAEYFFLKTIDKIENDGAFFYNNFGWNLILNKFYSMALKYLKIANDKFPNDIYIKGNLAHAYLLTEAKEEAYKVYTDNIIQTKTIQRSDSFSVSSYQYEDYTTWLNMITKDFNTFKDKGIFSIEFDKIINLLKTQIVEKMGYDVFETNEKSSDE